MDEHPVTNLEFLRFVKATGHVTWAEREPDPEQYPDADPGMLFAGSVVFEKSEGPVDLSNHFNWWTWTRGADWGHPLGPESSLHGRERHPVVHIAFEDAEAYAAWAGKEVPPRRNGSTPPGAAWTAPSSPGATSSLPRESRWRTPGRASSRTRIRSSTVTKARRRWAPFRRTGTASMT